MSQPVCLKGNCEYLNYYDHVHSLQYIAKFDNSVPGTIIGLPATVTPTEDNSSSTRQSSPPSLPTGTTLTPLTPLTTLIPLTQRPGDSDDLTLYIILAATGVGAMLFVILVLCIILVYCCSTNGNKGGDNSRLAFACMSHVLIM